MITVIDYKMGNLHSVMNALNHIGAEAQVSSDIADLRRADKLILPGVGAFPDAMAALDIEWDGIAHTSIADTIGCMKVWETLFPHYYENEPEANE